MTICYTCGKEVDDEYYYWFGKKDYISACCGASVYISSVQIVMKINN